MGIVNVYKIYYIREGILLDSGERLQSLEYGRIGVEIFGHMIEVMP